MRQPKEDTIAALATAPGAGAVAIVRLSGPAARDIAERLTGRRPVPRRAELSTFRSADGATIDRGLAIYFPGPGSYTGEDVVELHAHGSPVVCDWLLETAYAHGARPAEPGEFTLRAFLNDKLDLAQAEAVADLVASRSRQGAQAALRSLAGRFSNEVANLQTMLTELRALIEAWLDFPDEELDLAAQAELRARLEAAGTALMELRARAAHGAALSDGLSIAIAGPPNAGKSSLLNRLAGYDAAIVTDIPGTTRDVLKQALVLDGLPVHVVDTAGLRSSADPIEVEGVRRARLEASQADHVLWVADIREDFEATYRDAQAALADGPGYTVILNKLDLVARDAPAHGEVRGDVIELSALTGAGIERLVARLKELAGAGAETTGTFSARRRHLDALARVSEHLEAAAPAFEGGLELAAEELRAAQDCLGAVTGELTSDDLLGEIFARFCIGK